MSGAIERHLAELEPRLVGLEAGDGADELDDPGARAAAFEEAQRSLDVGLAERVPAAGDPDERLLRGGELGELLVRERDVADREPPVEACERRRREQSARAVAASARRAQVDAQAARLAQPGCGKQDGDAALLEPRPRLAEERPDLGRLELHLGRLVAELDPCLRQERLDLGEPPDQVAPRVARAQEREDPVLAVPDERRGESERRIVLRLEPQLEHE